MFYEEETSPCQVEEDDQTNNLQGKLHLQLLGLFIFVAMMTNRARLRHGTPFGADALFGEDIHPFFRTLQADQGHACPTLLVRNWCCSRKAGRLVFSPTGATKKKRKQEKEEGKTFRSERTVNFGGGGGGGKESTISEPKSLRPFLCAFFDHVEASTSPKLGFALCLYLDKLSLRRATPRRFWLSKTDLKTALKAK